MSTPAGRTITVNIDKSSRLAQELAVVIVLDNQFRQAMKDKNYDRAYRYASTIHTLLDDAYEVDSDSRWHTPHKEPQFNAETVNESVERMSAALVTLEKYPSLTDALDHVIRQERSDIENVYSHATYYTVPEPEEVILATLENILEPVDKGENQT